MPKWLYRSLTDGKIVKTQAEYDAAIADGYMCIDDLPAEALSAPVTRKPADEEDDLGDDEETVPAEDHRRAVEHIEVLRQRIAELEAVLNQPPQQPPNNPPAEEAAAGAAMETEGAPPVEEVELTAEQKQEQKFAEMRERQARK